MAMSTVASEKTGNCCLSVMVLQTVTSISACCFTSISRIRPPENRKYQSPARSQIFAMEKISSPRKWSLDLGQLLKGAWPNVRMKSK